MEAHEELEQHVLRHVVDDAARPDGRRRLRVASIVFRRVIARLEKPRRRPHVGDRKSRPEGNPSRTSSTDSGALCTGRYELTPARGEAAVPTLSVYSRRRSWTLTKSKSLTTLLR